jgi:hypothetical protein
VNTFCHWCREAGDRGARRREPILVGAMLAASGPTWLLLAGELKAVYNSLILRDVRNVRPPEEAVKRARA